MAQIRPATLLENRGTWVAEDPLWWKLYQTDRPGEFQRKDLEKFNAAKGRYILFGDHQYPEKMRECALFLVDRHNEFIAAKVSKFARDGELVCIIPSYSEEYIEYVKEIAKLYNLLCWKFKTTEEGDQDHEQQGRQTWMKYIVELANGLTLDRRIIVPKG